MKKIIVSILVLLTVQSAFSQIQIDVTAMPPCPDSTCMWGCPAPIKQILSEIELVFEGRILTDSFFCSDHVACVYHRVLVLKEFKGDFKSDTLEIAHIGGNKGCQDPILTSEMPDIHPGTVGVFFVGKVKPNFNQNPNIFAVYGATGGCGFVNVCDKKDVVKEVYEPIEAVTGPYVEVHPNTCATQQKPKK